jgi:hypothetical protein
MGKSVLMSSIIDKLHSEHKICVYYFFRVHNTVRRTTRAFILSIIAQLAMLLPDFFEKIIEIEQSHSNLQTMSTRVLWQRILVDTLFEFELDQPWYLVADGLDEAENSAEVISYIGKIHSKTSIKVLLASRIGMDLDREVQKLR